MHLILIYTLNKQQGLDCRVYTGKILLDEQQAAHHRHRGGVRTAPFPEEQGFFVAFFFGSGGGCLKAKD